MPKFVLIFCSLFSLSAFAQQPFWQQTNGPSGGSSQMVFNSHGDIFDFTNSTLLRSTDDGMSWKNITPVHIRKSFYSITVAFSDYVYIVTADSVFRSEDNGDSWKGICTNPNSTYLYASRTEALFLFGSLGNGSTFLTLWRSVNDGNSWQDISAKLPQAGYLYSYFSLLPTGELTLFGYQSTHFYYSLDNGDNWGAGSTLPYRLQYGIQGTQNADLFSGYAVPDSNTDIYGGYAIRSTDNGKTWDSLTTGFNPIITSNDIISAISGSDSIRSSTDYGATWQYSNLADAYALERSNAFPDQNGHIYWSIADRASRYNTVTKKVEEISLPIASVFNILPNSSGEIIAQGNTFFSRSSDFGKSWSTITGLYDSYYCGNLSLITRDSSGGIIGLNYQGAFRSTDLGISWARNNAPAFNNLSPNDILSYEKIVTAPNGSIFTCGSDNNIIRSTDLGGSWKECTTGLTSAPSPGIACDKNGMLYTFAGQAIYRSTNNGDSWDFMVNIIDPFLFKGIVSTSDVSSLIATSKGEIFAGTTHDGILISGDSGVTWKVINEHLDSAHISALFAAPNGDVYGISSGGALNAGVIFRPYHGTRWYSANDGLGTTTDVQTMAFASDGTAYLGTNGRGVWRSQGTVNAVNQANDNMNKLSIQISPNPASAYTIITYSLAGREFAKLDLCDALGRTMLTFANGIQDAGEHSVNAVFDDLASGIYFVRLTTANGNAVEKILIAK